MSEIFVGGLKVVWNEKVLGAPRIGYPVFDDYRKLGAMEIVFNTPRRFVHLIIIDNKLMYSRIRGREHISIYLNGTDVTPKQAIG